MTDYLCDRDPAKIEAVKCMTIFDYFMALDKKIGIDDARRNNKL